jgi:hypothetical protein
VQSVGVVAFPHCEGARSCADLPHVTLPDGRSVHVFQDTHLYDAIVPAETRAPQPPLAVEDLHVLSGSPLQPAPLPAQMPPVGEVATQLEHAIAAALMQPQPPPVAIPLSMSDLSDSTLE